jgi:hypothetical protein
MLRLWTIVRLAKAVMSALVLAIIICAPAGAAVVEPVEVGNGPERGNAHDRTKEYKMTDDFDAFFEKRVLAAEVYARGDFSLLKALIPETGEATFYSPRGSTITGAAEVAAQYGKDAAAFGPGGKSRLEVLQKGSSDTLGFWTGFQVASVHMAGQGLVRSGPRNSAPLHPS